MRQKLDIKQIINITMLVAILMMLGIISHIEPINSSRDSRKWIWWNENDIPSSLGVLNLNWDYLTEQQM